MIVVVYNQITLFSIRLEIASVCGHHMVLPLVPHVFFGVASLCAITCYAPLKTDILLGMQKHPVIKHVPNFIVMENKQALSHHNWSRFNGDGFRRNRRIVKGVLFPNYLYPRF